MKKASVVLFVLAVSLLVGGQVAVAGNPVYANVIATATCTLDGANLKVNAFLVQKDKPGPGFYEVPKVTYSLEQKVKGSPQFQLIEVSKFPQDFIPAQLITEVPAGYSVEVDSHTFEGFCSLISPNANAVRGVVEIVVSNANPERNGSLVFTGRCVSFPNPCNK